METIVSAKRSSVFFNPKNDTYLKIFTPKLSNKLKYFFKLRKYPGENFYYISKELESLGVKTVKVTQYSKYSVTTEKINGTVLFYYLKENPTDKDIIYKYIDLVSTILNNNIYCGDLNLFNFIVKDNSLYALDLEDYRHGNFLSKTQNEAIKRLYDKVEPWIVEEVKKRLKKES